MAKAGRKAAPYWSESRGQFIVMIRGKQVRLGTDEDAALEKFRFLMEQDGSEEAAEEVEANPPVAKLANAWLEHVEKTQSADRFRNLKKRLTEFVLHIGVGTRLDELRPAHIKSWLDKKGDLKPGTRRLYSAAVLACLNWCALNKDKGGGGLIPRNPLKGKVELPEGGSRAAEVMWTEATYKQVLAVANEAFADAVRFLRWTGIRPSLLCKVTSAHYNAKTQTLDVGSLYTNARSKKRTKRVWMPEPARLLVERLCEERPEGPLFRSARGKVWTSETLYQYLYNLQYKFKETSKLDWPEGLCMYGLRHLFATEFIKQHPDKIEYLRELLGHADLTMIRKHYAHLYDEHAALNSALDAMAMPTD